MGHHCPTKGEHRRSALGKWVKFYYPEIVRKVDVRFCNETQKEIAVYPLHEVEEQLREAIAKFFEHQAPDTQMVKDGACKRK